VSVSEVLGSLSKVVESITEVVESVSEVVESVKLSNESEKLVVVVKNLVSWIFSLDKIKDLSCKSSRWYNLSKVKFEAN